MQRIEMAMAANQVLQLLINLVQLDAEFTGQHNDLLFPSDPCVLFAGHVPIASCPALKRLAHDGFGRARDRGGSEDALFLNAFAGYWQVPPQLLVLIKLQAGPACFQQGPRP
jgi:hypothetical protein